MKYLLILLFAGTSYGGELYILEPRDIYFDLYENEHVEDPYLSPVDSELGYGLNARTDFNVVRYNKYSLFVGSLMHFDQSKRTGQVRHVGWEYEVGMDLFKYNCSGIQFIKQHHSRHILEAEREAHFPVYDRIGIRLVINTHGCKREN